MPRGKSIRTKIQESILKQRGLETVPHTLSKKIKVVTPNTTLAMRLLEEQYSTSIESLVKHGTLKEVSEFLGIDETTVSKWRLRLGLRTKANHD